MDDALGHLTRIAKGSALLAILSTAFFSESFAGEVEILGVSIEAPLDGAKEALEERQYECVLNPEENSGGTHSLLLCGIGLREIGGEIESMYRNPRNDELMDVFANDVTIPAMRRKGEFRIVSSIEIDSILLYSEMVRETFLRANVVLGYTIGDANWYIFSCAATNSCGRSSHEKIDALREHMGGGVVDFREIDISVLRALEPYMSRSFPDFYKKLSIEVPYAPCLAFPSGAGACAVEGQLVFDIGANSFNYESLYGDDRAIEMAVLGVRAPIEFIVMSSSFGSSGPMKFD